VIRYLVIRVGEKVNKVVLCHFHLGEKHVIQYFNKVLGQVFHNHPDLNMLSVHFSDEK